MNKKYQKELKKFKKLELQLIKTIADVRCEILMNKFLEWQNQRIKCNKLYIDYLEKKLKAE